MNWRFLMVALALAAFVAGCAKDEHPDHDTHSGHGAHEAAEEAGSGDEISEAFAGLSREDAKLAMAQKTCPVSDEELGSMGTPIKMTAGGRTVFLCCKGCQKKFLADPQTYIAKLDARKKK